MHPKPSFGTRIPASAITDLGLFAPDCIPLQTCCQLIGNKTEITNPQMQKGPVPVRNQADISKLDLELFMSVSDPPFCKVVWRQFDIHPVAHQDADAVSPHPA
jgi:hypothetical protein